MSGENSGPRGCKFITGSPQDIHTEGEAIYCRKQVVHAGEAWCPEHERLVYVTIKRTRGQKEAELVGHEIHLGLRCDIRVARVSSNVISETARTGWLMLGGADASF